MTNVVSDRAAPIDRPSGSAADTAAVTVKRKYRNYI